MKKDKIFADFLRRQLGDGTEKADASDILHLLPTTASPPSRYIAEFHCRGLVNCDNKVRVAERHAVGITFPSNYLRQAFDPPEILTWLGPREIFHPNIRFPLICTGRIAAGTPLTDLLIQVWEIITYQRYTPHDPINPFAAAWARNNQHRFPLDERDLIRRPHKAEAKGEPDAEAPDHEEAR